MGFVNRERFSGILVPFMGKTQRKAEGACDAMNAAQRGNVEGDAKERPSQPDPCPPSVAVS